MNSLVNKSENENTFGYYACKFGSSDADLVSNFHGSSDADLVSSFHRSSGADMVSNFNKSIN
ncbi:hypothetical protein FCV25MIE_08307, partial [Fagus crenata]